MSEYEVNIEILFVYSSNEQADLKLKIYKSIYNIIYLGKILTKYVQDLNNENYQMLMRKNLKD